MPHRLPDLHLRPPPTPLHPLANLPIPLPLHRPHPRLRTHPNPPPHRPRLVRNLAIRPSSDLERRPDSRQEHPHHLPADRLRRGKRYRGRYYERGRQVLRNVPYAHGSRFGFPDHRCLDCEFFHSAYGQALGCYCDLQRCWQLRFDLWDLLLSRWAINGLQSNGIDLFIADSHAESHDPHYTPGSAANAGVCVVVALLALLLRFVHIRENKKLEAAERDDMVQESTVGSDRRARGFRYVY